MILKFGKYKGQEIADVAKDNEGLSYLNWLAENTDVNDPKYGKNNKLLLAEINKALDGKTIDMSKKRKSTTYHKDTSQMPRDNGGAAEILKSLDLVITILKKAYPDVYAEIINEEEQVKEDEVPF